MLTTEDGIARQCGNTNRATIPRSWSYQEVGLDLIVPLRLSSGHLTHASSPLHQRPEA
ncbi:MAG TPA: hypothetical protein VFU32_07035 [Ktedonobacterales bacterium]|nr:hypothetical protein [Ktedonobacterales bacterium]